MDFSDTLSEKKPLNYCNVTCPFQHNSFDPERVKIQDKRQSPCSSALEEQHQALAMILPRSLHFQSAEGQILVFALRLCHEQTTGLWFFTKRMQNQTLVLLCHLLGIDIGWERLFFCSEKASSATGSMQADQRWEWLVQDSFSTSFCWHLLLLPV